MEVDGQRDTGSSSAEGAGLQGLPTNVLINIFGKACPSPYDRRLLFSLALVCKRFSNVLRQPSDLWKTMMLSLPRHAAPLSLLACHMPATLLSYLEQCCQGECCSSNNPLVCTVCTVDSLEQRQARRFAWAIPCGAMQRGGSC